MDDRAFDALTRALARGANRRNVLKGLLGLGGATLAGSVVLDGDSEAARRPANPTPTPVHCPGQQFPCGNNQCCCPPGLVQCNPNGGPDCCNSTVQVGPGYSECCDNACCHYPYGCAGEEMCCPRLPDIACLDAQGRCCATACTETPDGPVCCPSDGHYVCNDTECCLDEQNCCSVDGCCAGRRSDTGHCCAIDRSFLCNGECCPRGNDCCTTAAGDETCCAPGQCNATTGFCCPAETSPCGESCCDTADQRCCKGACVALDDPCCEVDDDCGPCQFCGLDIGECDTICTNGRPQCCVDPLGDYCIDNELMCCSSDEECGPCASCGDDGYCVGECSGTETCCTGGDREECCQPDLCFEVSGCCTADKVCEGRCCRADQYCCTDPVGRMLCVHTSRCCNDDQCTANDDPQHCGVGICQPPPDGGPIGGCATHDVCADTGEKCCPGATTGDPGVCASPTATCCTDSSECPDALANCLECQGGICGTYCDTGFVCDGNGGCVEPCIPLDGDCSGRGVCCEGTCCGGTCAAVFTMCRDQCIPGAVCCPEGAACLYDPANEQAGCCDGRCCQLPENTCQPNPGLAGSGRLGDSCGSDENCCSACCFGDVCAMPSACDR